MAAPSIAWQKCLGGAHEDGARSIHQTSDGGYIVAGYIDTASGDAIVNDGAWVVKLNANGLIEREKRLGDIGMNRAYSIQQTDDGGYIVAGEGRWVGFCVVKLDANLVIEWQKGLGGTGANQAKSIQQTSDGGYIVAGDINSNNADASGHHGSSDMWVVKLNADGEMMWQKCLGGTGSDCANSIRQTSDGGYIVAGESNSNNGDVTGNHGGRDMWVVKLFENGDIDWQKCLGGTGYDFASSVQQTSDGGYIVAGYTESNNGDVTGNHGGGDAWVVKLDAAGDIIWQRCVGGYAFDYAFSIQQTNDGGYVFAGETASIYEGWAYKAWVVKLDAGGAIVWEKRLGGSEGETAYSIQQTSDGDYIFAGMTWSNDGDVSGNHGVTDMWVVKLTTPVESITVTGAGGASTITKNGGSLQMFASVLPVNASNKAVTWSVVSREGDIATISDTGLLTATADGTVLVRATANDGSNKIGTMLVTISSRTTPIVLKVRFQSRSADTEANIENLAVKWIKGSVVTDTWETVSTDKYGQVTIDLPTGD